MLFYRFYTYGNFELERNLELINEQVLSKFTQADMNTAVPSEPRWMTEVNITLCKYSKKLSCLYFYDGFETGFMIWCADRLIH